MGVIFENRPEYTNRTHEAYHRQSGDGASHNAIRIGDRTAKDDPVYEESTDQDDIFLKQNRVIDILAGNPGKLQDPYSCLQENGCVLQIDDVNETSFLHQLSWTVKKKLMKRADGHHVIQGWMDGIYKIIPWVLTRNPGLLNPIEDKSGI